MDYDKFTNVYSEALSSVDAFIAVEDDSCNSHVERGAALVKLALKLQKLDTVTLIAFLKEEVESDSTDDNVLDFSEL